MDTRAAAAGLDSLGKTAGVPTQDRNRALLLPFNPRLR
jgi:hypothetical protein